MTAGASVRGSGSALWALALLLASTTSAFGDGTLPDLVVERGRLTMTLDAATPLESLLAGIGRAAGVEVVARGDLGSAPPQRLRKAELAVAIRRLAGRDNRLLMRFDRPPGQAARLVSVRVAGPSGHGPETSERVVARPPAVHDATALAGAGVRLVRLRPDEVDDPETTDRLKGQIYDHGRQADADAVAGLAEILSTDPDPGIRRLAANTLLNLAARGLLEPQVERRATTVFTAALGDEASAVRSEALRGLTILIGDLSMRFLARAVTADDDPEIRRQALHLLASLDGPRKRGTIEAARRDADPEVRRAAEEILEASTAGKRRRSSDP